VENVECSESSITVALPFSSEVSINHIARVGARLNLSQPVAYGHRGALDCVDAKPRCARGLQYTGRGLRCQETCKVGLDEIAPILLLDPDADAIDDISVA
jgi:hypothetical protein